MKRKSSNRFKSRYGLRIKKRIDSIEEKSRKKYRCIYCGKVGVKRVSAGIWQCDKCGAKFTGKAYSVEEMRV